MQEWWARKRVTPIPPCQVPALAFVFCNNIEVVLMQCPAVGGWSNSVSNEHLLTCGSRDPCPHPRVPSCSKRICKVPRTRSWLHSDEACRPKQRPGDRTKRSAAAAVWGLSPGSQKPCWKGSRNSVGCETPATLCRLAEASDYLHPWSQTSLCHLETEAYRGLSECPLESGSKAHHPRQESFSLKHTNPDAATLLNSSSSNE